MPGQRAASATTFATAGYPPTLLTSFAHDLVPAGQAQRMAAALTRARVVNQMLIQPGNGHALVGDQGTRVWLQTLAFLAARLHAG